MARQQALLDGARNEGRDLNAQEQAEFDNLQRQLESLGNESSQGTQGVSGQQRTEAGEGDQRGQEPLEGGQNPVQAAQRAIEDCTEVHMYVGKAINSAYQNPGLPFDLGIRQNLVEQLKHAIEEMGKKVVVTYY